MKVEILRDLLTDAQTEPNEKTRIGCFWPYASDYDECITAFKTMYYDDALGEFSCDECTITRHGNEFLIKDEYGSTDTFTKEELKLFIFLWDHAQQIESNIIKFPMPDESQDHAQETEELDLEPTPPTPDFSIRKNIIAVALMALCIACILMGALMRIFYR